MADIDTEPEGDLEVWLGPFLAVLGRKTRRT